jgi:hypothetical protein
MQSQAAESVGSGSEVYTMARSMRLGPGYQALSPHALEDTGVDTDMAGSYSDAGDAGDAEDAGDAGYDAPVPGSTLASRYGSEELS